MMENLNASEKEWEDLRARAQANAERGAKVYAEFGTKLNDADMQRHRVEQFIEFMLGERTRERLEFEEEWQRRLFNSIQTMQEHGEKYLKLLKEQAATNPQAMQELQALQAHRERCGVEGDISGLVTPRAKLFVPGQ